MKLSPPAAFLAAFMLFTSSTCEPCRALALADLTLDTFEGELLDLDPNGELIFSISIKVLNILGIANGCDGEDLNATAGPNGFLEQVVFSENGTFNDAILVDEMTLEISSLDPSEKAVVDDAFTLAMDGSYRFYTTVDSRDDVLERNENNNGGEFMIKSISREIVVTGTRNIPMTDQHGNPVYVTRKQAPTVRYEY